MLNERNRREDRINELKKQIDGLDDFLTIREVAEYLRVKEITIYRLIKQKKLKAIKMLPKKIVIPKEAIFEFLRNAINEQQMKQQKKEQVLAA